MTWRPLFLVVPLILCGPLLGDAEERGVDNLAKLAAGIVRSSAGVREGDLVQLTGTPGDIALLEELAVEVRKLGAHPLLTLTSDRLKRRLLDDVPAKFDRQSPRFELALAGMIDVLIGTEAGDEGALFGVPPARLAAAQKAAEPVNEKLLKRNVRTVWLGNRLYPTATRAKRYGLTVKQLRELFEAGLAADSAKMQATGARLRDKLAAARWLHLSGPGGTNVKMRVERRPVGVNDGVLTPERLKKGGADLITWLPAGEVFLTPVPGTAEGTVVAPLVFWEGRPIKRLELVFKAGKLTRMTAESGLDRLQAVYNEHGTGKEQLGAIDIGINPAVRPPAGSTVQTYVALGVVTLSLGNNQWAGGELSTPFGLDCHLAGCTLKADDVVLVERGKLVP